MNNRILDLRELPCKCQKQEANNANKQICKKCIKDHYEDEVGDILVVTGNCSFRELSKGSEQGRGEGLS